jgi:hypothetical protein
VRLPLRCKDPTLGARRPELLSIGHVEPLEVRDEAQIDNYELGPLEYDPEAAVLQIGGFPSTLITLHVRELDVRVLGRL